MTEAVLCDRSVLDFSMHRHLLIQGKKATSDYHFHSHVLIPPGCESERNYCQVLLLLLYSSPLPFLPDSFSAIISLV